MSAASAFHGRYGPTPMNNCFQTASLGTAGWIFHAAPSDCEQGPLGAPRQPWTGQFTEASGGRVCRPLTSSPGHPSPSQARARGLGHRARF